MDVTFTKASLRHYTMTVRRDTGVPLAPRTGPGHDPRLPHDLAHFVVEAEAGLRGGVFGRLAAGDCGFFAPADPREVRRSRRRERTPTPAERVDMSRSEELASLCPRLWEVRAGHRDRPPEWAGRVREKWAGDPVVERVVARLGEVAARWEALEVGGSLTLTWPHGEGRRTGAAVGSGRGGGRRGGRR